MVTSRHPSFIDETGNKYGRWTVLCYHGRDANNKHTLWWCRCVCGTEKAIQASQLRREGGTRSCGCLSSERLRMLRGEKNPRWRGGRKLAEARTRKKQRSSSEFKLKRQLRDLGRICEQQNLPKPNFSYADLVTIKEEQGYCCAICGVPEYSTGRGLFIDHCHSTGKIRGFLCQHCNTLLGMSKDSSRVLWEAMRYLGRHNE